jgi:MAP kinase interacting serine/threonine kinase
VLEELLGEGGFAKVYRGSHRRGVGGGAPGEPFALKVVLKEDRRKLTVLESESRVWRAVPPHPAIVALLGMYELPDRAVLVTELCQGSCLMDRLLEAEHFSEEHARGMARQVASAVWHLHAVGVAHRDLKPDNLLCTHPQPHPHGQVKLCDFGLASAFVVGEEADLTRLAGTPEYLAPEIVRILQRRLSTKDKAALVARASGGGGGGEGGGGGGEGGCVGKMARAGSSGLFGTPHMAHYSERVDLWALGCVV